MEYDINTVKNPVLLSTGCFTGRINGRNPELLCRCFGEIRCDGFELMLFDNFYDRRTEMLAEYKALKIPVPVVHANKRTGDLIGAPGAESYAKARELFLRDLDIAVSLGAGTMVFHPWGIPDSVSCPDMITERLGMLLKESAGSGVCAVPENCVCACNNATPLSELTRLFSVFPDMRVTLDTRAAAFHGELEQSLDYMLPQNRVRHMHLLDYSGATGDWEARKIIPQPGFGDIDWNSFFAAVRKYGYGGTLTMEAPHMLCDGVDTELFNRSLDFIREGLASAGRGNGTGNGR